MLHSTGLLAPGAMGGVKNVSTADEYADALRSSALVLAPGGPAAALAYCGVWLCVWLHRAKGLIGGALPGRRP